MRRRQAVRSELWPSLGSGLVCSSPATAPCRDSSNAGVELVGHVDKCPWPAVVQELLEDLKRITLS
eukprot:5543370-Alexandrium_andersonii.AAC.1